MNIVCGISEDIGLRSTMEDKHAIYDFEDRSFFSAEIYDGHGGRSPAQIAAEMLTPVFLHACAMEMKKPVHERRHRAELLRDAYLEVDAYIVTKRLEAGTCAVQLYLVEDRFMAANVGDSRVIIGTKGGAVLLTEDHKPDTALELSRIEVLGGNVTVVGVPRVQGILAISRALGDTCLKPYVSPEPRICEGVLGRENDLAVLACDGVWDVLSPDMAIEAARQYGDPQKAADNVLRMAKDAGGVDNITVIVLDIRNHTVNVKNKKMKILRVYDRA